MIRVRIELLPFGDASKARLLQELLIANVGGTADAGNYSVALSHSTTIKPEAGFPDHQRPTPAQTWKKGKVDAWSRKKKAPADLVMRALMSCLGVK